MGRSTSRIAGHLALLSIAAILLVAIPAHSKPGTGYLIQWLFRFVPGNCLQIEPFPSQNPLVIYPAQWGTFDPYLVYTFPEPHPCDWLSVTFTQTAGPQANVFPTVTVERNEVNASCANILHADCAHLGVAPWDVVPRVTPGIYTISATVTLAPAAPGATAQVSSTLLTVVISSSSPPPSVPGVGRPGMLVGATLLIGLAFVAISRRRAATQV